MAGRPRVVVFVTSEYSDTSDASRRAFTGGNEMSESKRSPDVVSPDTVPNLGLRQLVTLDVAEASAIELYGKSASVMVAWCALAARTDGRDEDYRFWLELFKRLLGNPEADATLSSPASS